MGLEHACIIPPIPPAVLQWNIFDRNIKHVGQNLNDLGQNIEDFGGEL